MAAPPSPRSPQSDNQTVWVLVGCAGLLILGLCVLAGFGAWLFYGYREVSQLGDPAPTPGPALPPDPGPALPPDPGPALPPDPGPVLPPPPAMDQNPRTVTATVTATTGSAPVSVGTSCSFDVERHPRAEPPGFWCRAQIRCAGILVYGGSNAGYFPCELFDEPRRDVVGVDDSTTATDTDAAMSLDTREGTLTIRDDASGPYGAYSIEARVTLVQ